MAQSRETPTPAQAESDLYFDPFRLERAKRLWHGEQLVEVRPRPLAVLRYLAERPGRLVTSEELLKKLWPGIYVTRTVLRVCLREVRQALDDNPVAPRFIETVGRQGYRFIAPLTTSSPVSGSRFQVSSLQTEDASRQLETLNLKRETPFVGREQELARLHELFARAQRGERQIVFLLGEPGIGKTALMNRFLAQVRASGQVQIGRGQCIEHYGVGEAYLPLLEALGQLCREPGGEQVRAVLRRYAPLWLVQLSGLVEAKEREAIQSQIWGSGHERMLREFVEALETVTADSVLVLVLEDLHWSDVATLEAVAYLAQRQRPARLLVLGTYRPAEVVMGEHPLRNLVQDLYGRGQCQELALELFTEAEVEEYLTQRLGPSAALPELKQLIYRRTDGNVLFVVSFVNALLQRELIGRAGSPREGRVALSAIQELMPDNVQQAILRQIERLPADAQQLLRVASVDGMTFTAAEVAEVIGRPLEDVEEVYDHLASGEHLIAVAGIEEWPQGIVSARYEFRHALYQQALYEQLGQGQRIRLHRQLGEWKEVRYGERATEVAGELARHFTEGRDYRRAVQYHDQAGKVALWRSAYREAIAHCQRGLELLEQLPNTPERQRQELGLRITLGPALTATQGYTSPALEQNLKQAYALCQEMGDPADLVLVLTALTRLYMVRADRAKTEVLLEQERQLLLHSHTPADAILLHTQIGTAEVMRGAHARGQEHHAQVLELYDSTAFRSLLFAFSADPKVTALATSGWSLYLTGWPERAWTWARRALEYAEELAHPFSLVIALMLAAWVRQFRGEFDAALALAQQLSTLGSKHGFGQYLTAGVMTQGSALVGCGELEQGSTILTTGLSQYRATQGQLLLPFFLSFLAEISLRRGQVENGLATVTEALGLTATNLDRFWEAELYRLKGELTLQQFQVSGSKFQVRKKQKAKITNPQPLTPNPQKEAEACFLQAIEIARQQEAKSLELRAATSLARLWQRQGKQRAARNTLSAIYGWFTEGFETKDLREAKVLLEELSH